MSRPLRTLMTLLGLWLFGGCEQSPPPSDPIQAIPSHPVRYFGRPANGQLHVYFLDVGQGDATLIVSPTGRTVLVDAGPASAGVHLANRLPELLTGKLDLVILTHPAPDHYGGLPAVLESVGALRLLEPQLPDTSADYDALLGSVGASGMEVTSPAPPSNGDPLRLPLGGGAALTVLWPRAPNEKLLMGDHPQELNSIVLRLTYGDTSVVLPGDALEKTEHQLSRREVPLTSTLLKVAAHGAATATSAAFLDAVRPQVALVSTGADTAEGAPSREVLKRLETMRTRVFRTDLDGEVMAVSDGQRFTLTAQRGASGGAAPGAEIFEGRVGAPEAEWFDAGVSRRNARKPPPGRAEAGAVSTPRVDVDLTQAPTPPAEKPREEKPPAKGGMRYVASRKSDVFHVPDCPAARRIKDENLLTFTSREQAADGNRRRPAKDCHP
jgi:competence protein ComEC